MDVNLADAIATAAAAQTATTKTAEEKQSAMTTSTTGTIPKATLIAAATASANSAKTLKRCLSVPILRALPAGILLPSTGTGTSVMTTRSAAAAAAAANYSGTSYALEKGEMKHETPKKCHINTNLAADSCIGKMAASMAAAGNFGNNIHIGIPRSNPSSREVSPAPVFNIFAPRARRYSASYSPLGAAVAAPGVVPGGVAAATGAPLCLTPRVSQLRKEECVDMNSREVNHEREVHSAMQMSQSWEDLTLVAENWSCKSDEFSNPLQVVLPSGMTSCSSPSPTSNRAGLRLPYGLSPSPTRRTFATRRSMSPIAMRPSQLGPVKRKFELDDNNSSNWNVYSPPPMKKIFTESRGSSPVCQSPSSVCPSPDSGTYDGRITPKLFISKLCTTNTSSGGNNNNNNSGNSACSSPSSSSVSGAIIDSTTAASAICSSYSSSSSSTSSISGGSEPMSISSNIDEGISVSECGDEKQQCPNSISSNMSSIPMPMSTDMQDEVTLMDDIKSETSSIGGCSTISVESSSCDSGAKTASFCNRFMVDDMSAIAIGSPLAQKNFFINKQGLSGAKKFIVNHDNLPNCSSVNEQMDNSINVSSTSSSSSSANSRNKADVLQTATTSALDAAVNVIVEHKM